MERLLRLTTAVAAVVVAWVSVVLIVAGVAAAAPAGSTFLVSRPAGTGPAPVPGDNESRAPLALSPDGRYVAFASAADGLAPGANPRFQNIFIRDRAADTTT